ncbi:MAG TPA: exodeoxyribonuclease V subunit gamma, partial [Candidatus Binataceae bacterium]|nr:exodeoxyribonuclease V subunit gamma [Candidatus Binataceae bacterium]
VGRMIHLHYSNRLEELIAPLAQTLSAQQRNDPLSRAVVVVPNRIIQEFLKLRLAQVSGVAANIEFPFLRRYLAQVVAAADPQAAILEADELELVIFECLRAGVANGDPELRAVADYASAGSQRPADHEFRLFELSVRTAHLFREYSISRAAMLTRWPQGVAPGLDAMREAERWQRHLYLSIFDADGRLLPRWITTDKSRYFLLIAALAAVAPDKLKAALASPLHVFALSYAGPEFVSAFARIGQITELHIYTLNPCMEFWEDVDSSFRGARELVHRGHKVGGALESVEDPFGLDAADDNLALGLWGKPGREYIRLLNELTDCDFDPHFKHAQPSTLLARIQEAILCREPHSASLPGEIVAHDESIHFLACPGIRREVEIVADSIWSLIRDDEKAAPRRPLRFHEIALLIPDTELDAYLPHVETVFAQRYQIPVNMVDRPFGAESRVVEAVQSLLELPKGHFNRDAVLHLVTHPAIVGGAVVDTEQWEQWCRSAGVFFGADQTELEGTYIPANHYHWDQALRRLALGVFMAGGPSGQTRTVAGPDGGEYLPCETAQGDLPSVGALIVTVRRLLADALDLRERHLPMSLWARLLSDLVKTYVNPAEPAGRAVAAYCAAAIESMGPEELRGQPVSYQVACARALARIGAAQSEQGRYAEGGVAVGSFSALRSIPFRAIFVLGMGETIFPQRDRRDLLDLRMARRRAGDVSPSQRDRYLFLETLLATRERIGLSWVSRDALTGQTVEPSPLIRELKLIISRYLGQPELNKLTTIHPASSYDLKYFPDLGGKDADSGLVNFDPNARRAARMAALRADLNLACTGTPPSDEPLLEMLAPQVQLDLSPALRKVMPPVSNGKVLRDKREIHLPLAALRRYLECPLQGAARYALGMIDEDGGDEDDPENEPLTQTNLDRTVLLREAFWGACGNIEGADRWFDEALRLHQLEGKAPVGPFAEAARTAFLIRLGLCVKQAHAMGVVSLAGWERIRIGGAAEEIAATDRVLDAIVLDVPIRDGAGVTTLPIALRGIVAVSANRDKSINCIARTGNARPSDFLTGFLSAIALAAAGESRAKRFEAIVVGSPKDGTERTKLVRSFSMFSPQEARAYLTLLIEDIFSGKNHYFLPIEAIEGIFKEKEGRKWPDSREVRDIIEAIRENEFSPCRSAYGPVRNPRTYPAPPPDQVIAIIKRRFGPINALFDK